MSDARYDFAIALIREAGAVALTHFARRDVLEIKSKGPQDMVSQADLETEQLIRARIEARFPEDAFLGEETGATAYKPGQGVWVVDPIDGTQPFIAGLTAWCVSIAYMRDGVIQFGVINAPARNELFAGGTAHPATLNGTPITGSAATSLKEGLVSTGYSPRAAPDSFLKPFERFLKRGGMFHREGSGALALCYVAAGRLIGFIEPHINSWDCLAGIAIVKAAGLETTEFLAGEALFKGNRLAAGNAAVLTELEGLWA
jgi:myo-inositol-1(or 4)-monophosphatase